MERALGRRLLFWTPPLLLLVAAITWTLQPRPVPVDLAEVQRGDMTVAVDEEGQTRVREIYVVSSPIAGRLRRIDIEVGDAVEAGRTVIARIERSAPGFVDLRSRRQIDAEIGSAEASLKLSDAEISGTEADLELARSELIRARRLERTEAVSAAIVERRQTDVLRLEASLAEARAQREMRRFDLETLRAKLIEPMDLAGPESDACCVPVQAPVDGVLLSLLQESETVIAAGMPLAEVGDPRNLEIVVDVLSRDAVRIEPGASVRIDGWGGDAPLAGVVRRIEPRGFTKVSALGVEEQRVNVLIDITDPPEHWQRLAHGFRVETAITVWQAENVLKVPLPALFRRADGWAVFRVIDGVAHLNEVELLRQNALEAAIAGGLGEGDAVVLYPSDRIVDGVAVVRR